MTKSSVITHIKNTKKLRSFNQKVVSFIKKPEKNISNTIITKNNFILIKDMLSHDELQQIIQFSLINESCSKENKICNYKSCYLNNNTNLGPIICVYEKILSLLKPLSEHKNLYNKIKRIFSKSNNVTPMFLLYGSGSTGIGKHTDVWSDWNMVIPAGDSSKLIIENDSFKINEGDVYIFNGLTPHAVEIEISARPKNILRKCKLSDIYKRYSFQLRHTIKESSNGYVFPSRRRSPRFARRYKSLRRSSRFIDYVTDSEDDEDQ